MTSTMKSPPGRSVVRTSTLPAGSTSRGATGALAAPGQRAAPPAAGSVGVAAVAGTSAAAPVDGRSLQEITTIDGMLL